MRQPDKRGELMTIRYAQASTATVDAQRGNNNYSSHPTDDAQRFAAAARRYALRRGCFNWVDVPELVDWDDMPELVGSDDDDDDVVVPQHSRVA